MTLPASPIVRIDNREFDFADRDFRRVCELIHQRAGIALAPAFGSRASYWRAGLSGVLGRAFQPGDALPCGEANGFTWTFGPLGADLVDAKTPMWWLPTINTRT